ncbi:jg1933 [Pararge aegeria aegeria]|uniref:Jg1933 protein n=1 Tax=Pararge aegeria aegeria TaxID=348720 RepID=A0A8S4R357_9NEOP|nr:jg1933 [Pararge aegeria aegeria]
MELAEKMKETRANRFFLMGMVVEMVNTNMAPSTNAINIFGAMEQRIENERGRKEALRDLKSRLTTKLL